jgi:hypothetical protein
MQPVTAFGRASTSRAGCCRPFTGAVVVVGTSVVWRMQSHEIAELRERIGRVRHSSYLQSDRVADAAYRGEWAEGPLDTQSVEKQTSQYGADHPGLVCMTWMDADFAIAWMEPMGPNKQLMGGQTRTAGTAAGL